MDDPYHRRWTELLLAEREKRVKARLGTAGADPRDWLLQRLEEMHARMVAAPGYVAPTAAEAAAGERALLDFLGQG